VTTEDDNTDVGHRLLITVSGQDRPGVAAALFDALRGVDATVADIGQITIRGHLVLCVELQCGATISPGSVRRTVLASELGGDDRLSVGVTEATEEPIGASGRRLLVTLMSPSVTAEAIAGVCAAVYLAVQRAGLHRRAKRLVVLDADSTLLTTEVIDQLAREAGRSSEVAAITDSAMAGGLDFVEALKRRVALLAGLSVDRLHRVAEHLDLAPGARTLVRTLRTLGFSTAVVSGGFHEVLDPVCHELGVDRVAANHLGVHEGVLTGEVVGPIVDRSGKASALRRFAAELGVPISQTVAVGDGANDVDMISIAGLGIAFNARPVLRDAADAAITVPYLDAVLYLLGIPREEIEAAEHASVVRLDRDETESLG